MHKIHHKIILGLMVIAVIAGIVYVVNKAKGIDTNPTAECAYQRVILPDMFGSYSFIEQTTLDSISFRDSTFTTQNPTGGFSIDGGLTWNTSLYISGKAVISEILYTPDIKGQIAKATFFDIALTLENISFTVKAYGCDIPPPVDPCLTTVTLDGKNFVYESKLGNILYKAEGETLSSENYNVEFSPNKIDWGGVFNLNWLSKSSIIYLRDVKTGGELTLTNASYDPINRAVRFDVLGASEEIVNFSKEFTKYTALDGSIYTFDLLTFSLSAEGAEFSVDNLKFVPMLGKAELTSVRSFFVRNTATGKVVEVKVLNVDTTYGKLSLSFPTKECGQKDTDGDGVTDNEDLCPKTVLPDAVVKLVPNAYMVDSSRAWVTNTGTSKLPNIMRTVLTMNDTRGCSCDQITELQLLGNKLIDEKKEAAGEYDDGDRALRGEEDTAITKAHQNGCSGGKYKEGVTSPEDLTGMMGNWLNQRGWAQGWGLGVQY